MAGRLVALFRVSTGRQGRSGLSLEAQQEAIRKFAMAEGMEIVAEFVEIESGKGSSRDALERRPVLAEALATARAKKATLTVTKLCRLSRDVSFISALMTERVPFLVCELGVGVDAFTLHLHAALAERERMLIARRTKEALAVKAKALALDGKRLGNPTNLKEAAMKGTQRQHEKAVAQAAKMGVVIRDLRINKKMTHREIADELNKGRHLTVRGGQWHRSTVAAIMRREGIA